MAIIPEDDVRWLPRSESTGKIEDRCTKMTDGSFVIVAAEVYDHPNAAVATHGDAKGTITGPWCLGREKAVRAELERLGYEEFTIVVTVGYDTGEED